jgi:integrase/recombinase XerD
MPISVQEVQVDSASVGNAGDGDDGDEEDDDGDEGDDIPFKENAQSKRPSFFVGARKLPRILKEEEVAEMMRISKPMQRDSILLRCMYFLGMSNAEAQNFRAEDIDSVNGTVRIHEGKNRRDRTLPVPVELMNDLKDYLGVRTDGFVIRGRDKKANRVSDRHIRRIVKGYAKEASVRNYDEIHPHTLRHSYATHLLNHGTPLEAVQNILGHERMETTAIYSYVHSQAVKEKIENALSS